MKENLKVALLGIIAFTLVVDVFIMDDGPARRDPVEITPPQSNAAANPTSNNMINPIQTNPINPNQPPAQQPSPKLSETRTKTSVSFAETAHDFGTIKQDTKNTKLFKFTNTGSEPLIIEDATGSCGCTVPKFPKEPIKPGETGEIEVVYSPGKQQGAQTKTVTITANTNPITSTLNISANVEPIGQ